MECTEGLGLSEFNSDCLTSFIALVELSSYYMSQFPCLRKVGSNSSSSQDCFKNEVT